MCLSVSFSAKPSSGFIWTRHRPQTHTAVVSENWPAAAPNNEDLSFSRFTEITGSARNLYLRAEFS